MEIKSPAILFYTSDFLTGVSNLTMEERGQYITLLCLQHQIGHLPMKVIQLNVPNVSKDVLSKFKKDTHGNLYQKRMEQEVNKRIRHCDRQRENVMKRLEKYKKNGNTTVIPLENENDNENIYISNKDIYTTLFEKFWEVYPKKKSKGNAEKWFTKNKPSEELVDLMIKQIELLKKTKDWQKQDGQFIPYPTSWLNAKGWEDEVKDEDAHLEGIFKE